MKTLTEIITTLDLRFTSGNSVPVESTRITREEWLSIKNFIIGCSHNIQKLDLLAVSYLDPEILILKELREVIKKVKNDG